MIRHNTFTLRQQAMHTALAERAYRTNSAMRPTLGAALSVAPRPFVTVRPVPPIFSKLESSRNF